MRDSWLGLRPRGSEFIKQFLGSPGQDFKHPKLINFLSGKKVTF